MEKKDKKKMKKAKRDETGKNVPVLDEVEEDASRFRFGGILFRFFPQFLSDPQFSIKTIHLLPILSHKLRKYSRYKYQRI